MYTNPLLHSRSKSAGMAGARYGASLKDATPVDEDRFCQHQYSDCKSSPGSYRFPGTRLDQRIDNFNHDKLKLFSQHLIDFVKLL